MEPAAEGREILAGKERTGGDTPYGATTPSDDHLRLRGPPRSWMPGLHLLQRRHYVAVMAFLGFANIYAMRANLTIALLEMTRNRTFVNDEGIVVHRIAEFSNWDSVSRGVILGAFFYGYICTQMPGGWLSRRYGGKLVYVIGVLGTALLTLLTPPLAHMGKGVLIVTRACEGLFEGVTYPAMHALWSQWAPPLEKTKLATVGFAGSYFGTVISMPISAWLGDKYGWPSIFYVFGLLALLWCAVWFKSIKNAPVDDKHITTEELTHIQKEIGYTHEHVNVDKPPWGEILRSKAVWAIVIAHFCENWGFYTMLTHLPKFMSDVLHYELQTAGILTALPYMAMGTVVIAGGQLADHLRVKRNWTTVRVRKTFCCGAFCCQTVFILLTAHAPSAGFAVCTITLAIGLGGFAWSGFSVNHLDLAPQYAGLLMGFSNTFATIPGMISPIIVGAIVTEGHDWQWRIVLYTAAMLYAVGALSYFLLASGERQTWADIQGGYMSRLDEVHERTDAAQISD